MAASMSEESLLDADLDAPLLKTRLSYSSIPNTLPQSVSPKQPKSKKCKAFIWIGVIFTLLVVVALTVVLVLMFKEPNVDENWQEKSYSRRNILLYSPNHYYSLKANDFTGMRNIWEYELRRDLQCKVSNCDFTTYRENDYYTSLSRYDAVIFDMDRQEASNLKNIFPHESAKTYFIFAADNPTAGQHRNLRQEKDYYNLTMSYKLDSDIIWQRYHFQYKWSQEYASPKSPAIWITADNSTPSASLVTSLERSKAKLSAVILPCRNNSTHSNLIKELKEYMDVEIHTDCEPPMRSPFKREDSCTGSFDRKYKFFLAFEEQLCADYVSENFYKALNCSIVPVVLGGADYKNFAPTNSYIDASSFNTLRELTDYLYNLERNLQDYAKYFWWKKYYDLKVVSPFCDICAKVMSMIDYNNVREPTSWHAVDSWWKDNNCTAKSKFERI